MTAKLDYEHHGTEGFMRHVVWIPFGTPRDPDERDAMREEMRVWCTDQYGPPLAGMPYDGKAVWNSQGSMFFFLKVEDAFALQMRFG
jgi:hypothetical protein